MKTYSADRVKACRRVILDKEGVCNLPASVGEKSLARKRGTVELPLGVSVARVLEPLLESSEFPDSPSFQGRIMLMFSL